MKRILFTLFFACALSCVLHAQATLQLKHDSLSIWVGQYEHPLNTLRARFIDTDSTLAIWGTDNTVFSAARKYNAYTDDSNTPFATYATLKAYVRQYFFVDASGSGSGTGGDLQTTTDAGNRTSNAIQVTGFSGLSAVNGAYIGSSGTAAIFGLYSDGVNTGITINNDYSFTIGDNMHPNLNASSSGVFSFNANGASFGRVSGADATQANNFVTMQQFQNLMSNYTGWGAYQDTVYTQLAPFTLVSNSKRTLPNRAQVKIETQKPTDVSTFYNSTDSTITGRSGDGLSIYVEFIAIPDGSTTFLQTSIDIGGIVGEFYNQVFTFPNGADVPQRISFSFSAYTLGTWQANGAKVKVMSDGQCKLYGMRYVLTRTHKAR